MSSSSSEALDDVPTQKFQKVLDLLTPTFRQGLSQAEQLELYGLYQQATAKERRLSSSSWDPVRRAKDAAWTAVQQLTSHEAMEGYVQVVGRCAQAQLDRNNTNGVGPDDGLVELVRVSTPTMGREQPTVDSEPTRSDGDETRAAAVAEIQDQQGTTEDSDTDDQEDEVSSEADGAPPNEAAASSDSITYANSAAIRPKPFLGVSPLVPRGRLDIGWMDLIRTAVWGGRNQQWPRHLVVGLSVRTLLDAWLQGLETTTTNTSKEEPCILMTPPINVPGMTDVLQHHGVRVVGVDLPAPNTVAVNIPGVQAALQSNNNVVAVLVVHIFGQCVATANDLETLATLAHQQGAALLVDAAEAYSGEAQRQLFDAPTATASPADITLYSFGLIKTNTALRGGVAVVKDPAVARALRRRMAVYPEYSKEETRRLWCKAVLTQILVTVLPHWCYGCLYSILIGPDQWDGASRSVLRGFPATAGIDALRRRLPDAIAALLWRRLQTPSSSVPARIAWARSANAIESGPHWSLPEFADEHSKNSRMHTYWLYPVLATSNTAADQLCQTVRSVGWDATRGGNLECCDAYTTPYAQALMDRLVCLPLHTPVRELVQRLDAAVIPAGKDPEQANTPATTKRTVWSPQQRAMAVFLLVAVLLVFELMRVPIVALLWCLWYRVMVVGSIGVMGLLIFQHYLGDYYLQTSPAFAKYADACMDTTPISRDASSPSSRLLSDISRDESSLVDRPPSVVLLTGCTGFVGSMLLRDLLWHRKTLGVAKVIVLCRSKRGKPPAERIHDDLMQDPMFQFLSADEKLDLVEVMEGDVSERFGGCPAEDRERTDVTHIIHCASTVSFKQTLADAAKCIITGSLHMQELATTMSSKRPPCDKVQFVHMSTAFVHGQQAASGPLPEKLYSLEPFDPVKIYDSMCTTQYYASQAMVEHGFPNTYTFSKCVAEHLLLQNDPDTIIMRPSIVGPALEEPFAGWAGRMPSTLTAGGCLYMRVPFSLWLWGPHDVPCIPVDQLSQFVLRTALLRRNDSIGEDTEGSLSDEYEKVSNSSVVVDRSLSQRSSTYDESVSDNKSVFNATFDSSKSAKSSSFTWREFACSILQVGALTGQSNRFLGNFAFVVMDCLVAKLQPSQKTFDFLQGCILHIPLELLISGCKRLGLQAKGYERALDVADLPSLFYPFTTSDFTFESDLLAPPSMSGEMYAIICATAVCRFSQSLTGRFKKLPKGKVAKADRDLKRCYPVSDADATLSTGLLWALLQPTGNIVTRVAGWLLHLILKMCFQEVTVDVTSFCAAARCPEADWKILAPTHRSFFDFLLTSYISFAIPELQIEMPLIAAATDFEHMPLIGSLARSLGAFYVSRGRQTRDPQLTDTIRNLKKIRQGKPVSVEIFLEGTRSRDRRFCEPKTGLLRCLHQDGATSVIVPIAISYEGIAEEDQLIREMVEGQRTSLGWSGLLKWIRNAFEGKVNLGRVHVAGGEPFHLVNTDSLNWSDIAGAVQIRQAGAIVSTQYHISATSSLLGLPPKLIRSAFTSLGVPFNDVGTHSCPTSHSVDSQLVATLQFSHIFASLFQQSKSKWAEWLWKYLPTESLDETPTKDVQAFVTSFTELLDRADEYARRGRSSLLARGFSEPLDHHVAQVAVELGYGGPRSLLNSSILMRYSNESISIDGDSWEMATSPVRIKRLVGNGEELGYWGHHDTKFVVKADSKWAPYVVLESKKQPHNPQKITGLLSFMAKELSVKIDITHEAFNDQRHPTYSESRFSVSDLDELKDLLTKVTIDENERLRHGTGHCHQDIFSIRNREEFRIPDGVIWPSSESQVQAAIQLAKEKNWCLIPFGGGTNVSGSTRCPSLQIEPRPILAMDMRLMDKVLWVNQEDMVARVESGITGAALAEKLKRLGFTIGHEPDSLEFSTLGGWIATKASGMKRSKYGNIEDIVIGVTAVGAAGMLHHGKCERSAWERESCSFDMRSIFLGSEGCLGVVTSAVVRLWPIAECTEFDSAVLQDFETATLFARELAKMGELVPASVRILDNPHFRLAQALKPSSRTSLQLVRSMLGKVMLSRRGFVPEQIVCITIGYEGSRKSVQSQRIAIKGLLARYRGVQLGSELGRSAYDATFTIGYLRDFALTYHLIGESFESFVPWSKVETVTDRVRTRINAEHKSRMLPGRPFVGARITQLYPTGACIYFYFCLSFKGIDGANEVYSDIEHAARAEILAHGGSLSHHHGIGKIRASFLTDVGTAGVLETIKRIKDGLDPDNIFAARNGYFALE